ncbi:MAG: tyrosine-type recombinase/integrase [Terracidiphilus sp.]|jgi:integrase
MKFNRERYQHGSVRKVPRSQGFAWEFRFYITAPDGKRKLKVQTFDSAKYPTERDVRKAVEGQLSALNAGTLGGKVAATLGTVIDRYMTEEFPALRHSTQTTNKSLIDLHIRPKWQDVRLSDVTAIAVKQWMEKLPFGAASKVRARNMVSKLIDLAMLWEYIPVNRNPMELIRVKGSTKRQKQITIITPAQFKALVDALPEPYNLMVLVAGCLGLRVSETLGLKWADFDFKEGTLSIGQVFTHGEVQNVPKTDASGNQIPVHSKLCAVLQARKAGQDHDYAWVFASPKTGSPYSDATILSKYLKPAAVKVGIQGLGWHTLRHSYKSWMAAAKISPAQMKDLMRHSDIETTMNVYGRTLTPELRAANTAVAEQLL